MLESIRKLVIVPVVPLEVVLCGVVLLSSFVLLVNDLIPPVLVYLLQVFLAF
jgi:hypothetical protein